MGGKEGGMESDKQGGVLESERCEGEGERREARGSMRSNKKEEGD